MGQRAGADLRGRYYGDTPSNAEFMTRGAMGRNEGASHPFRACHRFRNSQFRSGSVPSHRGFRDIFVSDRKNS
jgi:hypothetical protein